MYAWARATSTTPKQIALHLLFRPLCHFPLISDSEAKLVPSSQGGRAFLKEWSEYMHCFLPVFCHSVRVMAVAPDKIYKSKEACPAGVTGRPGLDWILNCVDAIRADVFKETSKALVLRERVHCSVFYLWGCNL